ncbi:MAG: hypothetical protein FJX67_09200 [Alphaproteobacteria bacterium]|nr:hypothetical protein [Alphaproteobacteria bacterium]
MIDPLLLAMSWRMDALGRWLGVDIGGPSVAYAALAAVLGVLLVRPCLGDRLAASRAVVAAGAFLAGAGPLLALLLLAAALLYVALPVFIDHTEPHVAALGWLAATGRPIYHGPDSAAQFAMFYGPLVYQLNAVMPALLGPSMATAKLGGAAALVATLTLAWIALRRAGAEPATAQALLGALAVLLLQFETIAYWNRPDSFILALVALALVVAGRGAPLWRWLVLGAIAAALLHLKLHAVCYAAPILVHELVRARQTWRPLAAMATGFAATLLLPFAPESVRIDHYLYWLGIAHQQGWLPVLLPVVSAFAAACLVPIAVPVVRRWHNLGGATRAMAVAMLLATALAVYPGTRNGGGPWHLLPLALVAVHLGLRIAVELCDRDRGDPRAVQRALRGVAVVVALVALPGAVAAQARLMEAAAMRAEGRAATAELKAALDRYPDRSVVVGYGDSRHYRWSFLRPIAVFAGHPYPVDIVTVTDLALAGRPFPTGLIGQMRECAVGVWLVPAGGEPFTVASFYDRRPAFPPEFRAAFAAAYQRAATGRFYDTWTCRGGG